jgi:uncharacterized protein YdaU (DUF1376 family)
VKRPWMPLNIGEFLQDTAHLSTTEIGAYMLLIMHYWARGGPCPNLEAFRRVTRLTARQWAQSGDVLRSFFGDDLSHGRLDRDLSQVIAKSEVNSANAKRMHEERKRIADERQAIRTTDLRPKTEKDVVVADARERDPARPLSSPLSPERRAAIALGLTFLKAAGFEDYASAPMGWYGVADRAAIWTANGWPEAMIVAETRMVLQRAAGNPPSSIKYFETVFATAAARAAQPTPTINVLPAEQRDVRPNSASGPNRSVGDALSAITRRLEQDDGEAGHSGGDRLVKMLAQG